MPGNHVHPPPVTGNHQSFADVVLGLGPVGFWPFGECRGSFANLGSAGDVAVPTTSVATSGVAYLQSGAILPRDNNKSIYLDGANNSRVTVATNALYNTAAFSFGIAFRCDTHGRVLMTKDFTNSWRVFVNTSDQIRVDALGATVSLIATTSPIQLGRWYYLFVTYDGTTCRIYLNGREIKAGAITLANTYAAGWSFSSTSTSAWIGGLDEAVWFNRCLSKDDVLTLYDALALPGVDAAAIRHLPAVASPADALHRKTLADLRGWLDWGHRHGVKVQVGEMGWPDHTKYSAADAALWNALHAAHLAVCDAYHADTVYWAASERLTQYLQLYDPTANVLAVAGDQAATYEAHPTTTGYVRGLNLSSPALGAGVPSASGTTGAFGNTNPGTLGANGGAGDYSYDVKASLDFVVARAGGAIGAIRLGSRHERLATTLGAALVAAEVTAVSGFLDNARTDGLPVYYLLHNFGQYWLTNGVDCTCRNMGSAEFTVAHYTDVLTRIVTQWNAHMGLVAIELVSEPSNIVWATAALWEAAAQTLVDALRTAGWKRKIIVPTWNYARIDSTPSGHPRPFVVDALDNIEYSVHHYCDTAQTGVYATDYADALADAVAAGF